jgi:hypothetical protein
VGAWDRGTHRWKLGFTNVVMRSDDASDDCVDKGKNAVKGLPQ